MPTDPGILMCAIYWPKPMMLLGHRHRTSTMRRQCNEPTKTAPGECGCAIPSSLEVDTDGDSYVDCVDVCPSNEHCDFTRTFFLSPFLTVQNPVCSSSRIAQLIIALVRPSASG